MRRERPYQGWYIVAAAFTLMFTGFGVVYSFAAFFKAFEVEFGAPRAHVSMVFSLCAFLYFVLGAPAGGVRTALPSSTRRQPPPRR